MQKFQLAEINVALMKGININDPVMKEFVDNLDRVNALAESSEGFVWRLKDESSNNATSLNPYDDEQILINLSVWESIEALENYAYRTFHAEIFKRRREWFQTFGKVNMAMWWIPEGQFPTLEEAVEKLDYLQKNGSSELVFDFKNKYLPPHEKTAVI